MMTSDSVRLIARTNKSIDLGIAHTEKVKDNDHWKLARCFPFNKPLVGNGSLWVSRKKGHLVSLACTSTWDKSNGD